MGLSVIDSSGAAKILPGYDPAFTAGVTGFTPVAAPTDISNLFGSATKIIRLKRVSVSSLCTTTAGQFYFQLVKRSTAGTLGSAVLTTLAATKLDSNSDAATAVCSSVGTANYTTLGTIVGSVIRTARLFVTLTTAQPTSVVWDFSKCLDQAPVLRASTEQFAINCGGQTLLTAQTIDLGWEWEEGSI